MMSNLYGNPHSASPSSQLSTQQIENIRHSLLRSFNADPEYFDLIFTANATASIKLVMEAFREQEDGFWYGYHADSHTSLVGVREAAEEHVCFESDDNVESWIRSQETREGTCPTRRRLFAYPAQSNMNGRRLPLDWCRLVRRLQDAYGNRIYTLLDAAAYTSTSPLDLSNPEAAPDFVALSLYKIFGFPDLGALIVRKDAAEVFQRRQYFGGGTVDMVVSLKEQWHAKKSGALHEQLEDGTLPIHSILALKSAMAVHSELFGTLDRVARHTAYLAKRLHDGLKALRHTNAQAVCQIYQHESSVYDGPNTQGPVVAFNMCDGGGRWISNTEVEKLATVRNVHLRTGGLCNPGGIATSLGLSPWEMKDNFSAGQRCGGENDIINGKPTGMIRVSLGAMSTLGDVQAFLAFVDEFFVDKSTHSGPSPTLVFSPTSTRFHVESLTVFPVKSCAGWKVPFGEAWEVRKEGLAWDREWCIVHQGTGAALSQKRHPRMALIRPRLDFKAGLLRTRTAGSIDEVTVPLSADPTPFAPRSLRCHDATVCGDAIKARLYESPHIADFFTRAVGVPCTLARFPAATLASPSTRHSKAHLQSAGVTAKDAPRPILLSNESPILTISRSSLNRVNEIIKANGGKAAHPAVFRANIVLAESPLLPPGQEQPFIEDSWQGMRVGNGDEATFDFLGGCRRCQMVCVDQESAEKNEEPFVTLAKTRRFGGRVLFGVHTALLTKDRSESPTIKVGDAVQTF